MKKYTNNENLGLSVAIFLATDTYDHQNSDISATGLLKPVREIILSHRIKTSSEYDISNNIPSRLGSAVHDSIEHAWLNNHEQAMHDLGYSDSVIGKIKINPTPSEASAIDGCIPIYLELRTVKEFMGLKIGGKFDFVGDGRLEDFKSQGAYSYMKGVEDPSSYIKQGSIYRWLNPDIITDDIMVIQSIITDWSKLESKKQAKRGYPQSRLVANNYQLMSIPETENFIRNIVTQIKKHMNTPEQDLPQCTKPELWQEDAIFKYYKNPLKTARSSANFKDYTSAHARLLADGNCGVIKEFKGKVRKCNYCNAFSLCSQKDTYIANGTLVPI